MSNGTLVVMSIRLCLPTNPCVLERGTDMVICASAVVKPELNVEAMRQLAQNYVERSVVKHELAVFP